MAVDAKVTDRCGTGKSCPFYNRITPNLEVVATNAVQARLIRDRRNLNPDDVLSGQVNNLWLTGLETTFLLRCQFLQLGFRNLIISTVKCFNGEGRTDSHECWQT